jgi:hypothetical protein
MTDMMEMTTALVLVGVLVIAVYLSNRDSEDQ